MREQADRDGHAEEQREPCRSAVSTPPRGRRWWCGRKTCGNQAKAARFRSRDQKACSAASG
ncbi:CGNR zinc finger domain-containing protein [Allokutzneria multivorans]|uniref:CGNR zinc finger domain-containing protein n=1 Tax=Allokutzneria multivorans TaxID=1142134 RepID=UPI003CD0870D